MKKILVVFISILFLISSILVENNNQYYSYLRILVYILVIFYLIIQMLKKNPVKIIRNKLDICIILLVISTMLPVLFNKYITFFGAIKTVLQYTYLLGIYIIVRDLINENKLYKILVNSIIIITIIIILIGIDDITNKYLSDILKIIKVQEISNGEDRLISTFGYANALGVYIASVLFLNITEYLNVENEKLKTLYKTITYLFMIGIILTYSKGVLIMLPIILFIYIVNLNNKKNEVIQNLIISIIFSVIYVSIFERIKNGISIWIILFFSSILVYFLNLFWDEIIKVKKRQKKYILVGSIIIVVIFVAWILVSLRIYTEYEVFSEDKQINYTAKTINNILGNKNYIFEFKIYSRTPLELDNVYKINIIQRDSKNQQITNHKIEFGTFDGLKKIEFVTHEKTSEVKIEFYSKYKYLDQELIIKELKINNEVIGLEYKLLPTKLIDKIKSINLNYKTFQERLQVMEDALKLSRENILIGIGGDAWQYKYIDVQEYNYVVNEIHSYPFKVILEFGITGILAYLGIVIILIKELIKCDNIRINSIVVALLMIMIHSVIDIDLEYTHILLYCFILFGILSSRLKEENFKLTYIMNIIIIVIIGVSIVFSINNNLYDKNKEISKLVDSRNELLKNSAEYKKVNREIAQCYEELYSYEKYNYMQVYYNIIKYYLESDYKNIEKKINEYYEKIEKHKEENQTNVTIIMSKIITIDNIVKLLENSKYEYFSERFKCIIRNEYNETIKKMQECLEKQYIDLSNNIYIDEIIEIYENYI